MKLLKRLMVVLATVGVLSGCGGVNIYSTVFEVVTPAESVILKRAYKDVWNLTNKSIIYKTTMYAIGNQRYQDLSRALLNGGRSSGYIIDYSAYPLCDFYDNIQHDERAVEIQYPNTKAQITKITDVYKSIYGISMETACNISEVPESNTQLNAVDAVVISAENTINQKQQSVLDSKLYDELISVSKSCNIAKNEIQRLVYNKQYLTVDDSDAVISIIARCKAYKLQESLQK